jgi:uncharacterized membrane protein SpoIIM required for sporulation
MKQKQFEDQHTPLWNEIEEILKSKSKNASTPTLQFPGLYRRLCQCLALSSQRGYSPQLTEHLHLLALQCHQKLYGTMVARPFTLHRWLLIEFPQRVRQEWRLLLLAMLAFWGVGLIIGILVWLQPEWAYSFMSAQDLNKMRGMYQSDALRIGRGGSSGDIQMFGFYIWNNVSIGFRTFAGGLFGGVPALLSIIFNGMNLGVVAAWLSMEGGTRGNFWSFVITHASFEVTGLLLSGVAGMRLGLSLLCPGRLSRRHALVVSSQNMFPVIVGAALMTALAAFFEAFWSGSPSISHSVKYIVGGLCWLAVLLFFTFAGRGVDATR